MVLTDPNCLRATLQANDDPLQIGNVAYDTFVRVYTTKSYADPTVFYDSSIEKLWAVAMPDA